MAELLIIGLLCSAGDTVDIGLSQAEAMCLKQNPSLISSAKTASSAAWSARGAFASYLPQASISASYSDQAQAMGGGFGFDTTKLYSITLSLTQSIFSPSGIYNIVSSSSSAKAQRALYLHTKLQTVFQVDQAYFELLKAQKSIEIKQKSLARAQENLKVIQARFQLGDASKADLARAQASVNQAEYELAVAKAGLSSANSALAVLLGLEPSTVLRPEDVQIDTNIALPDLDSLKAQALRTRKDLMEQRASISSSRAGSWYKLLAFLPEINIGYYWRYYDPDLPSFSNGLDDFNRSSGVYAQMNFNLSSYPFELAAQKDAVSAQEWSLVAGSLSVQKDVQDAYQGVVSALENHRLAQASLQSSKLAWELTQAQFQLGAVSQLELADARSSLMQAELSASSAAYDLALAMRKLDLAVGNIEVEK